MPAERSQLDQAKLIDLGTSGVWTPVDVSAAALVFAVALGTWEINQFGIVTARFSITFPVTANGAVVNIGGLPFNVGAGSLPRQGFISWCNAATVLRVMPLNNAKTFELFDSAGVNIINSVMSGKLVAGTLIYPTT